MAHILKIADMLFNRPILATESLAASVSSYLNERIFGYGNVDKDLAVNFNHPTGDASQYLRVIKGAAILPVMGGLTHRAMGLDALCTGGLSSYAGLTKAFDEAMSDDSIDQIILHVDSGGGQAAGCFDLANHIMSSRGKGKKITAYIDGMSASAAYALTCVADEVIASQYAEVGSIGVIMIHQDISQALEKNGVKPTIIKAGDDKGLGNPFTPLSDADKEKLQSEVDYLYQGFIGLVSNARGISSESVKGTQANIYNADEAKKLGLIDDIMSPEDFLSYISQDKNPSASKPQLIPVAEATNTESEMTEEERKEMEELRAFQANTLKAQKEAALQSLNTQLQSHAEAIGFDANAVALAIHASADTNLSGLFMSVIESAGSRLAEMNTTIAQLKEEHEKALADATVTAAHAVEESDAMTELGNSGDAVVEPEAEKNSDDAVKKAALENAIKSMIQSGSFNNL